MNTILYYFSGTGNSLVVARDLAAALGHTTLISIPKALRNPEGGAANAAGFVFPVYAWGPPRIVVDFINSRIWHDIPYLFAVCTCGGFPGSTLVLTDRALRARGGRLQAGFSIVMPGNYTVLYGAIPEAKQQVQFERAKARVTEVARMIKERSERPVEKNSFLVNGLTRIPYIFGLPMFKKADARFRAMETCTHCGVCAKICPRLNIDLKDGRPHWHGDCEQCMACLQWCPVEAIQFGRLTQHRKRYHHPAVHAKDLFVS